MGVSYHRGVAQKWQRKIFSCLRQFVFRDVWKVYCHCMGLQGHLTWGAVESPCYSCPSEMISKSFLMETGDLKFSSRDSAMVGES